MPSEAPNSPPLCCAVIVFAKAPVAGFAKTRLIPALGAQGAAALALHMLQQAVAQAVAARFGPVEVCCTPNTHHAAFQALALAHSPVVALTNQGDGDLGQRMRGAFQRALQQHDAAILIGTDVPALDAAYLHGARAALERAPVVLGPAMDGGYTLVGLRKPSARVLTALFDNMTWSTPQVLQETRQRLQQIGVAHEALPVLHDVDEAIDLIQVTNWPLMPMEYRHTAI